MKEATYETRCPACDEMIYPGEPMEINEDEREESVERMAL